MQDPNHTLPSLMGMDGTTLLCHTFQSEHHGLGCPVSFTLKGQCPVSLSQSNFLQATAHIPHAEGYQVFHGELLSLTQQVEPGQDVSFQLTFGCSLHRLDNISQHRAFSNSNALEIVKVLLSDYQIPAQFLCKCAFPTIPYIAQGGVSDFSFFLRVCAESGLVFYYRQEENRAVLLITDDVSSMRHHEIIFNPHSGQADTRPAITSLHHHQRQLPTGVHIQSTEPHNPLTVWEVASHADATKASPHLMTVSHPLSLTSLAECEQQVTLFQAQLDCQRAWWQVSVAGIWLQPGDTVAVTGHPAIKAQERFQVIQVATQVATKWQSQNLQPLSQEALLISTSTPYRQPAHTVWQVLADAGTPMCSHTAYERPTPALQLGKIVGEDGGAALDTQGNYAVQPLFTQECTIIHGVRLLQPSAGPNQHGMHFPLPVGTYVVLAHRHHQVDSPVLLGALQADTQPSPVEEGNAHALTIQGAGGVGMTWVDTATHQIASFYTEQEKHGISLVKEDQEERIVCLSEQDMSFTAQQSMTLCSGNEIRITSDQCLMEAKQDFSFAASDATHWQASGTMRLKAQVDWLLKTTTGLSAFQARERFTLHGKQVLLQAATLMMTGLTCTVRSSQTFSAQAGRGVVLQVKDSVITTRQSALRLQANQITLTAQQILKP